MVDKFGATQLNLSDIGKIVLAELMETFVHRPNIAIDEFVIMPNHVHVLMEIHDDTGASSVVMGKIEPNSESVAIAQLKSISTKRIRTNIDPNFAWQRLFYDEVVRGPSRLKEIREYIRNNPAKWHRDRNNTSGIYM